MKLSRRSALIAVAVALFGCGGDGGPEEFADFAGAWTLEIFFTYAPEDLICSIEGVALTVSQDGSTLSGGSTGGTEACSQTGTAWPEKQIGGLVMSGRARENSVLFTATQGSAISLTFTGQRSGNQFGGTFQGSYFLDPFDVGDVTVTGTWTARRP